MVEHLLDGLLRRLRVAHVVAGEEALSGLRTPGVSFEYPLSTPELPLEYPMSTPRGPDPSAEVAAVGPVAVQTWAG